MRYKRSLVTLLACASVAWATHCAALTDSSHPVAQPTRIGTAHLDALSSYSATLGTPIRGFGAGFPEGDGRLQLVFNGTFRRDDGQVMPVHTAVDVKVESGNQFLWDTFGPYGHPFTTRGDEPGTFRGTISAQEIAKD